MAQKGMDVEQVRRTAALLREAAEEISTLERELTQGLGEVDWTGPDSERFRGHWQSDMVPALQQMMSAVDELGDSAARNANEQDAVSQH
jgi:uncharacterized protein YukE